MVEALTAGEGASTRWPGCSSSGTRTPLRSRSRARVSPAERFEAARRRLRPSSKPRKQAGARRGFQGPARGCRRLAVWACEYNTAAGRTGGWQGEYGKLGGNRRRWRLLGGRRREYCHADFAQTASACGAVERRFRGVHGVAHGLPMSADAARRYGGCANLTPLAARPLLRWPASGEGYYGCRGWSEAAWPASSFAGLGSSTPVSELDFRCRVCGYPVFNTALLLA